MAIFTPRGLKIRLPFDYAFALIARLYPFIDAFKFLKTVEGLALIPSMITFTTGLICFYLKLSVFEIGLYIFIASSIGPLLSLFGIYVIPGLERLGTFYSYISGFGILLILLSVYGYLTVGLLGVVAFFVAKFIAGIVKMAIETILIKIIYAKTELSITLSEIHFFNAYILYAKKLGITTDISVSEEELKKENWMPIFEDLAIKWPEVVSRFTLN